MDSTVWDTRGLPGTVVGVVTAVVPCTGNEGGVVLSVWFAASNRFSSRAAAFWGWRRPAAIRDTVHPSRPQSRGSATTAHTATPTAATRQASRSRRMVSLFFT